MTTTYHTAIAAGAAGNASVFNAPLGQLDAILGDALSYGVNNNAELVAARSPYASLDARLDALVLTGGNVATKANGASTAGQKVLTVDATTGFVVGAYVTYLLSGTTLEGNTIASIQAGVSLTLGTNIGTGGVLDDSYISMISISEYQAAQAIPHAGTLMLPQTMEYANGNVVNANAYGASPSASAAVNSAAIQAAIDAAGAGVVLLPDFGTYDFNTCLDLTGHTEGCTLRGQHWNGTFLRYTGTGGNCIDLTASAYVKLENFTLATNGTPEVGILMGRLAAGNSAGNHRITNVLVTGPYSKAGIYSLSSEVNILDNVHVYQTATAGYAYYHSDTNDLSATSAYQTLTALANNATTTTIIGGVFVNWHASGGPVMHFKNTTNLNITGTYLHANGTPALGLLSFEGALSSVYASGIRQEGTASYGVYVDGTMTNSTFLGCYLNGTTAGIYGENGSTIQFSTFLGVHNEGALKQINVDTLTGCLFDLQTLHGEVRAHALNNIWLNVVPAELSITGGIGNTQFSQWGGGNTRMVFSGGGVFTSDLGWGIKGAADATGQAVGALQKKVSIYDEAGNILGYVPIYAAFTGP